MSIDAGPAPPVQPLRTMTEKELCPGSKALANINDSLR